MANRILWLDDDSVARKAAEEYLGNIRPVTFASSPEEAFALLEKDTFDLCVVDARPPSGDGSAIIRRMLEISPEVSCMALYEARNKDEAMATIEAGAIDVLRKPLSRESLAFTVEKVLALHHMTLSTRRYHQRLKEQAHKAMTDLERANKNLRRLRYYLDNLLNSSVDSVLTMSTDFHITYANRGMTRMLGYTPDTLMGVSLCSLLRGGDGESQQLCQNLEGGPIQNHESEMLHADGRFIPVMVSLSQVCSQSGAVLSVLAIIKDITKQKQLENALKEKTITDDLTGLYNQRYFYERLEVEIERARRQNHPLSLLLFDVDHFKEYNDSHGHVEGDRVLQAIGVVVRESTRGYVDIACRYGGDEFTIILPETGMEHARNIAERIRASFEAHHFDKCTLSVGLMTHREDTTAEAFIRFADEMMYLAKRSGGNRVYVFDPDKKQVRLEE